jgi:ABC-type multidrug transport system fused ATPase/permease subunit
MTVIRKLSSLLTKQDKHFLSVLFLFSIVVSVIETAGVSVIMPFIAVAGDFDSIHNNTYYQTIYDFFGFEKDVNFIIAFGVLLIFFYIFRSAVNMFYFHLLSRFSNGRYHLIAYRLFENYIGMPYRHFIERNSSELTKTIINEAQNLTSLISAILFMISEIFVMVLIYGMLLYVNWKITILLTLILLVNALFMTQTISKVIKRQGVRREEFQKRFYEVINTTFGNFKIPPIQRPIGLGMLVINYSKQRLTPCAN